MPDEPNGYSVTLQLEDIGAFLSFFSTTTTKSVLCSSCQGTVNAEINVPSAENLQQTKVTSVEPGAGQNTVSLDFSAAWISTFLISVCQIHTSSFFSSPLSTQSDVCYEQ